MGTHGGRTQSVHQVPDTNIIMYQPNECCDTFVSSRRLFQAYENTPGINMPVLSTCSRRIAQPSPTPRTLRSRQASSTTTPRHTNTITTARPLHIRKAENRKIQITPPIRPFTCDCSWRTAKHGCGIILVVSETPTCSLVRQYRERIANR